MPLYFSHADRYLQYTYVLFERTWNSTILLTRTAHALESLGFHFAPLLLAAFTLSLFCLSVLPFLAIPSPMENVGILLCITSSLFLIAFLFSQYASPRSYWNFFVLYLKRTIACIDVGGGCRVYRMSKATRKANDTWTFVVHTDCDVRCCSSR